MALDITNEMVVKSEKVGEYQIELLRFDSGSLVRFCVRVYVATGALHVQFYTHGVDAKEDYKKQVKHCLSLHFDYH